MSDIPDPEVAAPTVSTEPLPETQPGDNRKGPWGRLLVLGIAFTLLIVLLLPAIRTAREAARGASCNNNLKQLGLAIYNYCDKYGRFPPAYTIDSDGKPLHSWRTLLLPFICMEPLYDQIRLDEPWNSPHNLTVFEKYDKEVEKSIAEWDREYPDPFPSYYCPSCPKDRSASYTSYAMVVGPDCVSDGPTSCSFKDLVNGSSNTIIFVETTAPIRWYEPKDIDIRTLSEKTSPDEPVIGSFHPTIFNIGRCDGSADAFDKDRLKKAPDKLRVMLEGRKRAPKDFRLSK